MSPVPDPAKQQQFLEVISRDEAAARFQSQLALTPLGSEEVSLAEAVGRVLAVDVVSPVDVSGFDRSNVDGFAIRAADTFGAMEESPASLRLTSEVLAPGVRPAIEVDAGAATAIATGGMLPRGADAVVMIEDTDVEEASGGERRVVVRRALSPGQNLTFAGTDVALGETVLRAGQQLSSREIGVMAAVGLARVEVYRKPRVAILSTGNEIVPPGSERPMGAVYDSNLAILSAAVAEQGGEPVPLGIVGDDEPALEEKLTQALQCDAAVLSGGTSKGAGDLSYRVIERMVTNPGVVAHGVALKPGKPVCLAVTEGKPVVILPGFPTSAIFTFHEFVAPVIRKLAGRTELQRRTLTAELPYRVNSDRGRTEYLLVGLIRTDRGLTAYPMGKGSGSVTTFSAADGFITIDQHTEILEAGDQVDVRLLGESIEPADFVVIGSHCRGLDLLLRHMHAAGLTTKVMHVGSNGGLAAARRGECDVAGIHLLDEQRGEYNRPFLSDEMELIAGYRRRQCFVFRPDDVRFSGKTLEAAVAVAKDDPDCAMVNRNAGSGTRVLIDQLLVGAKPSGYALQPKSHNAVAAAVRQARADWGVTIDVIANEYGLATIPLCDEHFDFAVPKSRSGRPAIEKFRELLQSEEVQRELNAMGFSV